MTTVQEGLTALIVHLGRNTACDAPREARLLLAHAMDVPSQRLTLLSQDALEPTILTQAYALADRRQKGEPISHILGRRLFYGRDFFVDRNVLDPRPETEELIAQALKAPFATVLDLGTGSGAIIVTLLAERPNTTGVATDISAPAIKVATRNAQTHDVTDRLDLAVSDWFGAMRGTFDLIVSNPPYIALNEMDGLQSEVRLYEPRGALTDEADGLSAYRRIIADAPPFLNPQGRLLVEIGPTQGAAVAQMMADAGLSAVSVLQDLDGRDRVVGGEIAHFSKREER